MIAKKRILIFTLMMIIGFKYYLTLNYNFNIIKMSLR